MAKRIGYWVFRAVRAMVKLVYRDTRLMGLENLPEGACVIVGNHSQMNGPIMAELFIPGDRAIWCNAQMMHLKEVPDYAYADFWSKKPAWSRWFYRLLSYIIAPLSVSIFNNAHCIGVYHDTRIIATLRQSLARLKAGAKIVIFPETDPPFNHVLYTFHDRFIDIGRLYAHQAKQPLAFVPMYICPRLKRAVFGAPITYDPSADPDQERRRVRAALQQAITDLADSQPPHRIVPFRNIPRRLYPMNKPGAAKKP